MFSTKLVGTVFLLAVELLNEPRLHDYDSTSNTTFSMDTLKAFYSHAAEVVRSASSNGMTVTIHDAFWGPQYWMDFDPTNNSTFSGSSPDWLQIDTASVLCFNIH